MDIRVRLLKDEKAIRSIVEDPRIMATIAENGCDGLGEEFYGSNIWLGVYHKDDLAGCYNFHRENGSTLQIHIQILPEHRRDVASKSMKPMWEWFLSNVNPDFKKINCKIPAIYPNVKIFAMQCGFKKEGVNRLSYTKNGVIYDQTYLGITRNEVEGWLNELSS